MEGNLPFLPCLTLYLRAISEYKPPGGILEGQFNGGFFCITSLGGLELFGGAITWRGLFSEFYGIIHSKYFPDSDWLKAHV